MAQEGAIRLEIHSFNVLLSELGNIQVIQDVIELRTKCRSRDEGLDQSSFLSMSYKAHCLN